MPLITAAGSFILNWVIFRKSLSESLTKAALIGVFVYFIGLIVGLTRWIKIKQIKNSTKQ